MSESQLYIDPLFFSQLANGDKTAFREIFHHFYPRLEAYVLKITRNNELTQEIVSDVLLTVWLKHKEFATIDHPVSWIFKVATNRSYVYLKKLAREGKFMNALAFRPDYSESTAESRIHFKESASILQVAIQRLPEQQQLDFKLSREEGLSTQEIAGKMGLSQSTVKNHLVRALKSVRQFVANMILVWRMLFVRSIYW